MKYRGGRSITVSETDREMPGAAREKVLNKLLDLRRCDTDVIGETKENVNVTECVFLDVEYTFNGTLVLVD